jgi:Cas6 Crispr
MPSVDLAFRLTGSKVPVDHGYALCSAISRLLPEIHGAKNIGVHPARGTCEQTVAETFFQPGK